MNLNWYSCARALVRSCGPLAIALLAAVSDLPAQSAFVTLLGSDTLTVERFSQGRDQLTGEVLVRFPRAVRRAYTIRLDSAGRPVSVEQVTTVLAPPRGPDSIRTATRQLEGGAIPLLDDVWGYWELLTTRFRRGGGDSLRLPAWRPGSTEPEWVEAVRLGRDSLVLRDRFQEQRARVDGEGRILSAHRPAAQFRLTRLPVPHLASLATAWGEREQREGQPGVLSPPDSLRVSVAGASLRLRYSRPSRRGRVVFGRLVPWNEVWRTGANAATMMASDRPLELGGRTLAPGAWSLWTIPADSSWTLIINADSAPGANRDPARDLYHLPMRLTRLPRAVEQLTIVIEPEGPGGVLRIRWDLVEASIPFTVR